METTQAAVLVSRDGVVESFHTADAVVSTADGRSTTIAGSAERPIFPRSALKPFQVIAARQILTQAAAAPTASQLAIGCASHEGGDDHQVEAASVLASAGLDESALRCPPDWPLDERVRGELRGPDRLSHNCSGKHAMLLWAHVAGGADPASYLDPDAAVHRDTALVLADMVGEDVDGWAIDGCGAPAFRITVRGLARAFARLHADDDDRVAPVAAAMRDHPELVGGPSLPDTRLMQSDLRVLAKRGAEGVMGAGFTHPRLGPLGLAVKIHDGGDRAAGPVLAALLEALGAVVDPRVRRPVVTGGGEPHGEVVAAAWVSRATTEAYGLV